MKQTITYEAEASAKKQVKKYQIFSYVTVLAAKGPVLHTIPSAPGA